jgi:hypothetical protein
MTAARDELRRLVEQSPDEQIPAALAEVQRLAASAQSADWPPPWFGAVTSKRSGTPERWTSCSLAASAVNCDRL